MLLSAPLLFLINDIYSHLEIVINKNIFCRFLYSEKHYRKLLFFFYYYFILYLKDLSKETNFKL